MGSDVMKLYLVQHAEAVTREVDPQRPLSVQGRHDAEALANFLARAGIGVARVVHSGKTRAQETASVLGGALCPGATPETMQGLGPNDPVMPFAERAAAWREDTLVVGHLPFVARAVCLLTSGDEAHAVVGFRPGSAVCLEREADGPWELAWMLRPELVRS
jgi:phosphohistidine phosphatase